MLLRKTTHNGNNTNQSRCRCAVWRSQQSALSRNLGRDQNRAMASTATRPQKISSELKSQNAGLYPGPKFKRGSTPRISSCRMGIARAKYQRTTLTRECESPTGYVSVCTGCCGLPGFTE